MLHPPVKQRAIYFASVVDLRCPEGYSLVDEMKQQPRTVMGSHKITQMHSSFAFFHSSSTEVMGKDSSDSAPH